MGSGVFAGSEAFWCFVLALEHSYISFALELLSTRSVVVFGWLSDSMKFAYWRSRLGKTWYVVVLKAIGRVSPGLETMGFFLETFGRFAQGSEHAHCLNS